MGTKEKKEDSESKKFGGLAFFASMLICLILLFVNALLAPRSWGEGSVTNWLGFLGGGAFGGFFAHFFMRGKLHVFIHELKHSIPSNLAGNRFKKFNIGSEEGYYKYSYTKKTAALNAFIALAPYCLPLFTLLAMLIGYATNPNSLPTQMVIVGVGYGIDLILNTRDISPVQTDLTIITGGYRVAVAYVVIFNLFSFSFLIAWISQGLSGMQELFKGYQEGLSVAMQLIVDLRKQ